MANISRSTAGARQPVIMVNMILGGPACEGPAGDIKRAGGRGSCPAGKVRNSLE